MVCWRRPRQRNVQHQIEPQAVRHPQARQSGGRSSHSRKSSSAQSAPVSTLDLAYASGVELVLRFSRTGAETIPNRRMQDKPLHAGSVSALSGCKLACD